MSNEGTKQLKTYIRNEISRLKALQDFDAALTVLDSMEEKIASCNAMLIGLQKEVENAQEESAKARKKSKEQIAKIEAEQEAELAKLSKQHAKNVEDATARHAETLAKIEDKTSKAELKLSFVLEEITFHEAALAGLKKEIKDAQAQKDKIDALVAKIKAV